MPLVQLLESSPQIHQQYNINQIVSMAGNGQLTDKSECSIELRYFLRHAPPEKIAQHLNYCLDHAFEKSGFVLQDIINELGRRLDYQVEDGLYQGRTNKIGYDGIWRSPDGHALIIEIKTSDAFRINLDTIAEYRNALIESNSITDKSSILIVVGRKDTGDLEAQIRGSRHAWDVRIISTDALIKLLKLQIGSGDDTTTEKIRSLLVPFEYTRLDEVIDIVFTTAQDIEASTEAAELEIASPESLELTTDTRRHQMTGREIAEAVRQAAVSALSNRESITLIKHNRTLFWTDDRKTRIVSAVSKLYDDGTYWFGFHPSQKTFLEESHKGFLLLGCVNNSFAYAIPHKKIFELLPFLNTTTQDGRAWWHINLNRLDTGTYSLSIPRQNEDLNLTPFAIKVIQ